MGILVERRAMRDLRRAVGGRAGLRGTGNGPGSGSHALRGEGAGKFEQQNADERGSKEYNLALGQKRAEAVRQALSLLGVPESQLEAVSYGEEKPAAAGTSEVDLAKNRRVEIRY